MEEKQKIGLIGLAVGFLLAGDAGDEAASALLRLDSAVVTKFGLFLLWVSALVTLYTGWDYFRAGARHLIKE